MITYYKGLFLVLLEAAWVGKVKHQQKHRKFEVKPCQESAKEFLHKNSKPQQQKTKFKFVSVNDETFVKWKALQEELKLSNDDFQINLVIGADWWRGNEYNFLIVRLNWHGKNKTIEIEHLIQK